MLTTVTATIASSLLDRLIVTAHRACCAPIYLVAKTKPSVPLARAFAVIMCFMQRRSGGKSSGLKKLIDATTNRDFSLLVLVLAIAGKLDLFLWMAGIGVHLFWIIALRSQWRGTERAPAISEESA